MDTAIITALIGGAAMIAAAVIGVWKKREKKPEDKPELKEMQINSLKLYAINSRYWAGLIQDKKCRIDRCEVFVRPYIATGWGADEARYNAELEEALTIWRELESTRQIQTLEIYRYDHLSDLYYCIIDNKWVYTSLNTFERTSSTGQSCDTEPVFFGEAQSGEVEKFRAHFRSMREYYREIQEKTAD